MRSIGLWLAAALCCGIVQAQVPHKINYQGYLTNPGGTAPVSATVQMQFKLYTAASGPDAPLYAETQSVTATNGVFNVIIGAGTSIPGSVLFDQPYYLGVTVGTDAEMTPRQPVAASAYAIRAASAESLAASAMVPAAQIAGTITSAMTGTGAAQFVGTVQGPNDSIPPGMAFTIDNQVFNSIPAAIVAAAGNGGTVFTLGATGTYALDYEMSLAAAGSVGIYRGPAAPALSVDSASIAGAATAATWIHGRTLIVVGDSPVVFAVSPVVGTASVISAGTAVGSYLIRLTVLKIS